LTLVFTVCWLLSFISKYINSFAAKTCYSQIRQNLFVLCLSFIIEKHSWLADELLTNKSALRKAQSPRFAMHVILIQQQKRREIATQSVDCTKSAEAVHYSESAHCFCCAHSAFLGNSARLLRRTAENAPAGLIEFGTAHSASVLFHCVPPLNATI